MSLPLPPHLLLLLLLLLPPSLSLPPDTFSLCASSDPSLAPTFPSTLLPLTPDGESCLHLLAISCSLPLLQSATASLDNHPHRSKVLNLPVATKTGLDMPPLSWYVFGLHVDCVEHLVGVEGVEVNLVFRDEKGGRITVMDVVERMRENGGGGGEVDRMREVLVRGGAKRREELEVEDDNKKDL
ncbi:hypothetical protein TrCOL_g7802 [Triparma columacea]|uniref:Uncharacterized protein n=1 Tax=Triparma columacea TaxID=722753 RepID=A0A9W7LC71_9STRA|nr:hypothetical protein TrCOL_g7802 [Triparma columacea]